MHILLVADGGSPITRRWIEALQAIGQRVSLLSTYPCGQPAGIERLIILPVAFSQLAGRQRQPGAPQALVQSRRHLLTTSRSALLKLRYLFGPYSVRAAVPRYERILRELKPDLVHALRIPFEGMLASYTPPGTPLAVSIWGNDLTLHAPSSPGMASLTKRTLRRADGLLSDVLRDQHLARQWGFSSDRLAEVVPGNGGIDMAKLRAEMQPLPARLEQRLPANMPLVVNPRGIRAYARSDTFFHAIPLVHQHQPQVGFVCPGMQDHPQALSWIQRLKLDSRTTLLPSLPQGQLWGLFNRSLASVSITTHDGTPNTLLEAMACGSLPIAGDIEALREWIVPGENGLLVDPSDAAALAEAIIQALEQPQMRADAARKNISILLERAEVSIVRPKILAFYEKLGEWGKIKD